MNMVAGSRIEVVQTDAGDDRGLVAERFGHDVLGPIFAEFAQRLWMFQRFLPVAEDACLLFCARGGLRLRLIYECFLARTGLQPPLPYADLMISRLVAARTSIATPNAALRDELGREFAGQTMLEALTALTQEPAPTLGPAWNTAFETDAFFALLQRDTPDSIRSREVIARLDTAFRRHLEAVSGGRSTILLCDTGLYGSTVRLLRAGVPDKRWIAAQFARSNYKGFATPHFDVTVGLSVESDGYAPWNPRTAVLRFWHLIESVLEPDLMSVRTFSDEPLPRANLEVPGWRDRVGADTPGLFTGVVAYLNTLSPGQLPAVGSRADSAWLSLRRAIVWPRAEDLLALTVGPRTHDFGRSGTIEQFPQTAPIRSSLWREGAMIQRYPRLGRGGLIALEIVQTVRTLVKLVKKWRKRRTAVDS